MAERLETATLAAGCFWCEEAVLSNLSGVLKVRIPSSRTCRLVIDPKMKLKGLCRQIDKLRI